MDPIDEEISILRGMSDQDFAFYADKLQGITNAYRSNMRHFDKDRLLNMMVKTMVESPNTREDLCYLLVTAIDREARK